jgi:hypothetical protein
MAKHMGVDDHAKVKVRVVEFELEGANATVENSIRQLTQAITATRIAPKPAPPKQPKELNGTTIEHEVVQDPEPEVVDAEPVENGDAPPAKKMPRTKAKPKAPTYLHDLMEGTQLAAFKAFAKEKNPTTRPKQYLTAAYWLKEHGGHPTVNADKIYTCFKNADWQTNFNDWRATFDRLVYEEDLRKTGIGEFAINPTGEAKVK